MKAKLVKESLNSFVRGRSSKKAIDVGMVTVWPEVTQHLKDVISEYFPGGWSVHGEQDPDDDEYYISLKSKSYGTSEWQFVLNMDQRSLWVQHRKEATHYGDQNETVDTNMYELDLTGDTSIKMTDSIVNQITKIMKGDVG